MRRSFIGLQYLHLPLIAITCSLGVAGIYLGAGKPLQADEPKRAQAEDRATASSLESAFIDIADNGGPATVSIQAEVTAPRGGSGVPGFDGQDVDPFELFGQPRRRGGQNQDAPPRVGTSMGSGVIIRSDGYILTNDHVVEGAKDGKVTVKLSDGTLLNGVVKRDTRSDLAVVKVTSKKPLPAIKFADSTRLHVGQWAIAIGSPFGKENTMTTGIVSALHRKSDISDGVTGRFYPSLIQTDAAINRGNSGGPLFNIRGELIGINVAIYSPTGTSVGIGYAIPSNTAKYVSEQLISMGRVTRGSLGLIPVDVTADLRSSVGTDSGAYVKEVVVGGAADTAGIQAGDVITKIGDTKIVDETTLRDKVGSTKPSTKVDIIYVRDGKPRTTTVILGELKGTSTVTPTAPIAPEKPQALLDTYGFTVRPVTDEVRSDLGLPKSISGIIVVSVRPNSPAGDADLTIGTIITHVGMVAVNTVAELDKALKENPSTVRLRIVGGRSEDAGGSGLTRGIVILRVR